MRILYVTPQPPWPPQQGTALRNFHLLQALAREHQVDLLTFAEGQPDGQPDGQPELPRGPLEGLCGRVEAVLAPRRRPHARLLDLALGRADMEGRLRSPTFAGRLAAMLQSGRYDAVQLEGLEVAGYLLGAQALRDEAAGRRPRPSPSLVFDDHNAEYQLQASAARIDGKLPRRWPRALYSAVQARRLRSREALYCAAADVCLAVSDQDARALEAIVPGLGAVVVPNGVTVGALPPPQPALQPVLFFAGKLDYRPNVDACEWLVRQILPRVRRRVPTVQVVLAGRDPAPAVLRLAGDGVEVTGALSDVELDRRRASAWVYVVPMRMGSGVRFKALEAMAAGVPLVATTLGAAGLGVTPGVHASIADGAPAFAAAVVELLERPQLRQDLSRRARHLAATFHDWGRITPRLLEVYAGLAGGQALSGGAPRRREDKLEGPGRDQGGGAGSVAAPSPDRPVSVVATVLNERASVDALTSSLAGQSRRPGECVVVDGGSSDGTWERLGDMRAAGAGAGAMVVLRQPGANIARGRNRAIAAARHDVIAVTDAGVRLAPEWLARLTAPLQRDATLQVSSGFFHAAPQSLWELALGATTLPDVGEIDPARFLPSSRSIAFRREAWRRVGGYPEWLDYGEDLVFDLALRRAFGPARFVPRATVDFRPRPTPAAYFRQYYRYARGDGKADLWRRRHGIRYASYLAGGALLWLGVPRPSASGSGRRGALALLPIGGVAYLRRPFIRLWLASANASEFCRAAPLVPLARLIGDVAKMLGYPAGLWWRLSAGQAVTRASPAGPSHAGPPDRGPWGG